MQDPYYGVIVERTDTRDYLAGGEMTLPLARSAFKTNRIVYRQDDVSLNSCTLHGSLGAYSDLTGRVFTVDERKALWEQAKQLGASDDVGWYVDAAVNLVRKSINAADPANQIVTFRVATGGDDMLYALDLGYSVVTGYRGNQNYNNDFLDDGILNGQSFGNLTYGHCLRIAKTDEDQFELVIDNYPQRPDGRNTYKVTWENLKKLVENDIFFTSGYIFCIKSDYVYEANLNSVVPVWARAAVDKCRQKKIIEDWSNPSEVVIPANSTIAWSLKKAGVISDAGDIQKYRWAVILDKLKLL